jgi:hypothetical protein
MQNAQIHKTKLLQLYRKYIIWELAIYLYQHIQGCFHRQIQYLEAPALTIQNDQLPNCRHRSIIQE